MANYPMNIWVINESEFDRFTFTGGKIVYIADEPEPKFRTHPAITTAGALLPPFEAIQAELDGNIFESNAMYQQYLQREDADIYVSILIAAAVKQIPIGIMFGRDELNMQFPKMFIDYLYQFYGLVLGIDGKVQPYIEEAALPLDLAKLYNMNIIDYPAFLEKHPPLPIHPSAISKLAYEQNPAIKQKDFEHYAKYFEDAKQAVYKNGGKFLVDPLVGI